VTGAGPLSEERAARFLALIPIANPGRFTLYQELAHLIVADLLRIFLNQPKFESVYWHAGRTVFDRMRKVCQKKMSHLGRTDAVHDVEAKSLLPGFADMRGQRL